MKADSDDSASNPLTYDKVEKYSGVEESGTHEDEASQAYGTLLEHVGSGGKYQWIVFLIASFCGFNFAFNSLAAAFLAPNPVFWCNVSDVGFHHMIQDRINMEEGIGGEFPSHSQLSNTSHVVERTRPTCEYYAPNFNASFSDYDFEELLNDSSWKTIFQKEQCHSFIYDDSIYKSTVVTEWDLVCDKRWMMTSVQAIYMAGVLVGAVVLSEISDLYGRRTVILVSSVGFFVCGVAAAFSTHFIMFIILRFLVACFGSGLFLPAFVLVMEMAGAKTRTTMGLLYQGFFGLGFVVLPGIAYFIRDWRNLQLAISIPSLIHFLYFKILPESPLWLLSQGRQAEALQILKKMAKVNGRSLPDEKELRQLISRINRHSEHSATLLGKIANFFKNQVTLVRTPIMRRRCLIIFFSWFVVAMVYYGLAFSGSNINASIYLMIFLSGIVEIPSYFIACLTLRLFGRRLNISACFIICGIACMLMLAVPKDMVWLNLTLASVGKFFNSIAFAVAYIFSAELVPTKVRNIAVGTSSMWARVGSTLAPFIVDSLGQVHYVIPSTIFGILSILAGLLDLLLPETGNSPLPETIEEVEALDR